MNTYRNLRLLAFALAFSFLFSASAFAAGASASATATAEVVQSITIVKEFDLAFGRFTPNSGGTVTVSSLGTRTASAGIDLLAGGVAARPAQFQAGGAPGASFALSLPASIVLNNGVNNMTLDSFVAKIGAAANPDGLIGAVPVDGTTIRIFVAGTLNVGPAQVAGIYTGTFSATVNYN